MAAPSIRAAGPEDAEEVERLRVAGWQAAYRGIVPDNYLDRMRVDGERRRRRMAEQATAAHRSVLVESVAVQGGASPVVRLDPGCPADAPERVPAQ